MWREEEGESCLCMYHKNKPLNERKTRSKWNVRMRWKGGRKHRREKSMNERRKTVSQHTDDTDSLSRTHTHTRKYLSVFTTASRVITHTHMQKFPCSSMRELTGLIGWLRVKEYERESMRLCCVQGHWNHWTHASSVQLRQRTNTKNLYTTTCVHAAVRLSVRVFLMFG